jgi:hypothetical protein
MICRRLHKPAPDSPFKPFPTRTRQPALPKGGRAISELSPATNMAAKHGAYLTAVILASRRDRVARYPVE